ncbi:MAG TPA: radical SAM protein [Candidatus Aminicenantes bacterium]|nr:MAG: hypothetical protein C0168_05950 [Candidatus Aminicenantes bacterium]HEK86674.1 radical SAM protein [Candidatus Aminicenantes bacterium]
MMSSKKLEFSEFKKVLTPEAIITSVPDLYFSTRNTRTLVVEPESASWIILQAASRGFLLRSKILRPGTNERSWKSLAEIYELDQSFNQNEIDWWLYSLFLRNMITLNGQTYYQSSNLWAVQQYPHYFNIHIAESCNLACRYCRCDHEANDRELMSVETVKKIIRRVLEEIPREKVIIGFHGGEPLTNIDCLVAGAKYARELASALKKKLTLSLQTNGVLLTRYSELLKELKIEVGLSLDGPEAIHNRQRVFASGRGSFGEVIEGLRRARKLGLNPGLLAVISDPQNYVEVAKFFIENLDSRSFRLNFLCYEGRAKKGFNFEVDRAELFVEHWLKLVDLAIDYHRETGYWLSVDDLNLFIAHLADKSRPQMCYRAPCGAGNSILGFGYDGQIYPCEELVGKDEFCLGTIDDPKPLPQLLVESEINQQIQQQRKVENIKKCRTCPWRRFHGSGCLNKSFEFFGDIFHEDPMCHFYRRVFEELMWKTAENPDLINLIGYYKNYLKDPEANFLENII